jgi:hypothetical protein
MLTKSTYLKFIAKSQTLREKPAAHGDTTEARTHAPMTGVKVPCGINVTECVVWAFASVLSVGIRKACQHQPPTKKEALLVFLAYLTGRMGLCLESVPWGDAYHLSPSMSKERERNICGWAYFSILVNPVSCLISELTSHIQYCSKRSFDSTRENREVTISH